MTSTPPILWLPVFTADKEDRSRVLEVLAILRQTDPAILVRIDPRSEELLFGGTSIEHLQGTFNKIANEYRIPAWKGEPRVRYIETIRKPAEAEGKYIRQTGGSGNYAHVKLRLEPAERGSGIAFVNSIQGGVIPQPFIPAVELGIREAAEGSILAGYEVADMKITLFDGSFHEVDSNEMAFMIAASLAFKEAARKGRPVILEPVMSVLFTVPEAEKVSLVADIWRRRGEVTTVEVNGSIASVRAKVPLENLLGDQDPALHIESFAGYREKPSGHEPGDPAGVTARRPRGPSPKTNSAAANIEWDWT